MQRFCKISAGTTKSNIWPGFSSGSLSRNCTSSANSISNAEQQLQVFTSNTYLSGLKPLPARPGRAAHLAFWTLLGIPLPVLNLVGPMTQQLVSPLVFFAANAFMPGRVALETPDKLARRTLDLYERGNTTGLRARCWPSWKAGFKTAALPLREQLPSKSL